MNKIQRKILSILVLVPLLGLSGCTNFDYSKVPLYDEVFVPPKDDGADPRKSPPKNPLVMPPGYKKPTFNTTPGEDNSRIIDIYDADRETSLAMTKDAEDIYPRLSEVPQSPDGVEASKQGIEKSQKDLEAAQKRAEYLQQALREGKDIPESMLADTRPPALPASGEESQVASLPWQDGEEKTVGTLPQGMHPEGLRNNLKPLTFTDDKSGGETPPAQVASTEPTHEFGTPEEVEGGAHSTSTKMHDVGYKSQEEMEDDNMQFRLKPFEYRDGPKINEPKIVEPAALTFNDIQDPPRFLPESRYKARRVSGPYYRGTFAGSTYFSNQY